METNPTGKERQWPTLPLPDKDLANRHHKAAGTEDRAKALVEWRERAGLTQREASARLEIKGQNTLSRWETGQRRPDTDHFNRAIALYKEIAAARQSTSVPRGTYVAEPATARYAPERVTAAPKVAGWLLRFRADLVERGATEAQAERAADLVAQVVRSPSATGKHDEWTVDEALEAMQPEADEWLDRFGRLGP